MRNGFTLPSSFLFSALPGTPSSVGGWVGGCNTYHPYTGEADIGPIAVPASDWLSQDVLNTLYGSGPFVSSRKWLVGPEQLITFAIGQSMQKLIFWRPSSCGTSAGSVILGTSSWMGFRKEISPPFVCSMGYRARLQRTEPTRSLALTTAFRPSPFQMTPTGFTRRVPENFPSDVSHQEQRSP